MEIIEELAVWSKSLFEYSWKITVFHFPRLCVQQELLWGGHIYIFSVSTFFGMLLFTKKNILKWIDFSWSYF